MIDNFPQYVAEQLLSFNEDNKWEDPDNLSPEKCLAQDNEIFHVARSITCIHFMNVLREDFLRGLDGTPMAGPSAQVDILYVQLDLLFMLAYNHIRDRMSEVRRMTKQAAFPLWSHIFCIV